MLTSPSTTDSSGRLQPLPTLYPVSRALMQATKALVRLAKDLGLSHLEEYTGRVNPMPKSLFALEVFYAWATILKVLCFARMPQTGLGRLQPFPMH